jgi:hypothetical protein
MYMNTNIKIKGPLAKFGGIAANDASIVFASYLTGQSEMMSKGMLFFSFLLDSTARKKYPIICTKSKTISSTQS